MTLATVEEGIAWVTEYIISIKERLKRIYGGMPPREVLAKYQDMAQEHSQLFFKLMQPPNTRSHSVRRSISD
eukprot:12896207-Prorocentrum_lima.AAC.1